MTATAHTTSPPPTQRGSPPPPPRLHAMRARRRRARLHLLTYVVGNALFWTVWGAISVSADRWYWWPIIPSAGWAAVLGLHLWHVHRALPRGVTSARKYVRVAALLLIAGLVAGPISTHVYWLLGGTWGLHTDRARDEVATAGVRIVAAVVVLLLVAAVLVVLARVALWQQSFVSDGVIRFFAWSLAAVFMVEALAAFTWSREHEWWLYGPASLVIALLALVVAGSGDARPRFFDGPHRTLPSR